MRKATPKGIAPNYFSGANRPKYTIGSVPKGATRVGGVSTGAPKSSPFGTQFGIKAIDNKIQPFMKSVNKAMMSPLKAYALSQRGGLAKVNVRGFGSPKGPGAPRTKTAPVTSSMTKINPRSLPKPAGPAKPKFDYNRSMGALRARQRIMAANPNNI